MYSRQQAKKLGLENTINLKYIIDKDYMNSVENKTFKDKATNICIEWFFILGVLTFILLMYVGISDRITLVKIHTANASEVNIFDAKIEKFCKHYGEQEGYKHLINRCAKIGKAQMRFELGSVCEGKEWNNNCFNFRAISKYNRLDEFNIVGLDKAGFTIFEDKSSSLKYFAYRFYKYDRKKSVREIVMDFTHSKEDWDNYENFILNYKD